MFIDVRGRVQNTPLLYHNCLFPLFEAIANSMHAVEDAKRTNGKITISIERDTTQGVLFTNQTNTALLNEKEKAASWPIRNFIITDNGIGFTDENFRSFDTSDSLQKAARGGKGIGRLYWLKAFEKAEVTSVYRDDKGLATRRFTFAPTERGVESHTVERSQTGRTGTTVKLIGFREKYREACPKSAEAIAQRIIEHCLQYLVLKTCPQMTLDDPAANVVVNLNDVFVAETSANAEPFTIKGQKFQMNHVQLAPHHGAQHRLYFCAHNRSVKSEPLTGHIPNLERTLKRDDGRPFLYAGYVSGDYLDQSVAALRTDFDLPDGLYQGELSWDELTTGAVANATGFLTTYTDAVKVKKEEYVRDYVRRDAPQYRPLLKHKPETMDRIPPNLTKDKLDLELYKLNQEYDAELQDKYKAMLGDIGAEETANAEEHKQQFLRFLEEWNERGIAKLAQHIIHRKATLSFLESRLHQQGDGTYHREEAVHQIIFPLRSTSDDLPPDKMNLWILDEKLAYHYYLASDKLFNQVEVMEVDSKRRPDILIFDNPFAFVDEAPPFRAIILVEFKRPSRDEYTDDENPIDQILDYIDLLRAGKAKDRHGKTLSPPKTMPFHAFIVCSFTPKLHKYAKRFDLNPTADDNGYFGYHKSHGVYIEIMSFDKLLDNAQKRNAILFDHLGVK